MPPRGHSSSSHSSSSFRSSGSSFRSSSSSFRGPSSHSSSSHSSIKIPSGTFHSRTSSAGRPAPKPMTPPPAPPRPRVNQPTGFVSATRLKPSYYYGLRHSYIYYSQDWVDRESGKRFEKGYYDENGQRYDSVTFQEDGRYKNVVCHCPYCGQDSVLDLSAGDAESHSLKCPHCGGPMEIRSELDTKASETSSAGAEVTRARRKSRRLGWLILAAVVVAVLLWPRSGRHTAEPEPESSPLQGISAIGNTGSAAASYTGEPVYLEKQADGSYHPVTDPVRAEKILLFDREMDSYYDESSDCWLWYNRDVSPAVWQYWYEGISSDFGDWGWMEHDDTGWYIERSENDWVPLPVGYDTAGLWYIQ